MHTKPLTILNEIRPRLCPLLPAEMNQTIWSNPTQQTLTRVYEHLRTLHRMLHDYVPRQVSQTPPQPGQVRFEWQEGTLMFTDLAGFTRLTEIHTALGRSGAETLLGMLNTYFANIIEIISKAGGDLLEFTGDALLVQFPPSSRLNDTAQAVRAGLRMQRAMRCFEEIETPQGTYALKMRVGIHRGRFLTADVGTPQRMERVLMGRAVQTAKQAEGNGVVGRVCLTQAASQHVQGMFRFEAGQPAHLLVIDDLSDEQLGEYDIVPPTHRSAASVLWQRDPEGLAAQVTREVASIEPLASFLPATTLRLVVESTTRRRIQPDFPVATVVFVNLLGLAEKVDQIYPGGETVLVSAFSHILATINQIVEQYGGMLKKVTYHLTGSDLMVIFGVPDQHDDDTLRAVQAALAIREAIKGITPLSIADGPLEISCQIGMARGPVFAAEVGEPHGRREFNILGDPVNTAARLMNLAHRAQILVNEAVYHEVASSFHCVSIGAMALKGKTIPTQIYALSDRDWFS